MKDLLFYTATSFLRVLTEIEMNIEYMFSVTYSAIFRSLTYIKQIYRPQLAFILI